MVASRIVPPGRGVVDTPNRNESMVFKTPGTSKRKASPLKGNERSKRKQDQDSPREIRIRPNTRATVQNLQRSRSEDLFQTPRLVAQRPSVKFIGDREPEQEAGRQRRRRIQGNRSISEGEISDWNLDLTSRRMTKTTHVTQRRNTQAQEVAKEQGQSLAVADNGDSRQGDRGRQYDRRMEDESEADSSQGQAVADTEQNERVAVAPDQEEDSVEEPIDTIPEVRQAMRGFKEHMERAEGAFALEEIQHLEEYYTELENRIYHMCYKYGRELEKRRKGSGKHRLRAYDDLMARLQEIRLVLQVVTEEARNCC